MHKKGVILLLILLCVAFLVSCAKKNEQNPAEMGELVRTETEGMCPFGFIMGRGFFTYKHIKRKALTNRAEDCYNR